VLAHRRREVLHFNVTDHPTAEWIAQQVVEACAYRDAPKYLIRDHDRVYGSAVRERLQALRIQEVLIAPASPWQNCYVERLIGSIRRECLNHVVILNARHLKHAHFVLRLLPAFKNAFSARKGMPDTPSGVRPGEDCPDSLPGRFTSLL
jgi:transposase InsO family protein